MDPVLVEQLMNAVVLAVVGIIAYALRGLVQVGIAYLQARIGKEKTAMVWERALSVVRYLEQSPIFKNWAGEAKKEFATGSLVTYINGLGIELDEGDIDQLVEAAVHVVKKEFGKV